MLVVLEQEVNKAISTSQTSNELVANKVASAHFQESKVRVMIIEIVLGKTLFRKWSLQMRSFYDQESIKVEMVKLQERLEEKR